MLKATQSKFFFKKTTIFLQSTFLYKVFIQTKKTGCRNMTRKMLAMVAARNIKHHPVVMPLFFINTFHTTCSWHKLPRQNQFF